MRLASILPILLVLAHLIYSQWYLGGVKIIPFYFLAEKTPERRKRNHLVSLVQCICLNFLWYVNSYITNTYNVSELKIIQSYYSEDNFNDKNGRKLNDSPTQNFSLLFSKNAFDLGPSHLNSSQLFPQSFTAGERRLSERSFKHITACVLQILPQVTRYLTITEHPQCVVCPGYRRWDSWATSLTALKHISSINLAARSFCSLYLNKNVHAQSRVTWSMENKSLAVMLLTLSLSTCISN